VATNTFAHSAIAIGGTNESEAALAILYEHPRWFIPMFQELDSRGTRYEKIYAPEHFYAIDGKTPNFKVLFNRLSPSAEQRQHGSSIFHTLAYLERLELLGVRVLNGSRAFRFDISKALQLSLLQSLGIANPRSRIIHDARHAVAAAENLRYPIVVKANIGGSGAGIARFDTPNDLEEAVQSGTLHLGFDHVGLVQEFILARGGHITRVETLAGKFLYAIRVHLSGRTFDLCPADFCQTQSGESSRDTSSVEPSKASLRVECYIPPPEMIAAAERIVAAAGIDVGGIEYIVDDRDGQKYVYDVNALSNFVADAPNVIGFDPFVNLASYLESVIAHR
jgi:hypothetical protein